MHTSDRGSLLENACFPCIFLLAFLMRVKNTQALNVLDNNALDKKQSTIYVQ